MEGSLLAYRGASNLPILVGGSLGIAIFICLAAGLLGRMGLRMRL